jgi:hypothetical protein
MTEYIPEGRIKTDNILYEVYQFLKDTMSTAIIISTDGGF